MKIGAAIRTILLADSTLNSLLQQVSPLVMGQEITLPYCVYEVSSTTPSKQLNRTAQIDTVTVDLTVFGKNYLEVHNILSNVRRVLDGYCGIEESVQIYNTEFESSNDAFNTPALIYGHTQSYTLKVKSTEYIIPVWVLANGNWVGANKWTSTGLWNSGN